MATKWISPTWRIPDEQNQSKFENYSLDLGASGYISTPASGLSLPNDASLSFWFNADTASAWAGILSSANYFTVGQNNTFAVQVTSGGDIRVALANDQALISDATITFNTNTWNHMVVTLDTVNNNFKVYLNSLQSGTTSSTTQNISGISSGLIIGGYSISGGGQNIFDGKISQVSIFDYALSQPQINYLYNSRTPQNPMAISGNAPIAYYPLGGGSTGDAAVSSPSTLTVPNESVPSATVFDFSGTNPNQIEIPASTDFVYNNNDFSISTWFYKTGTSQRAIFSKGSAGNGKHFLLFFNNTTTLRADFYNSAATGDFSFVFSNNQWYHILLTRNSSGSVTLYVNGGVGETITPDYADGNISNSTGYIGKYWAQTGMNFQGQLSNFQIYNSVLTQSNAETLYNNGVPYTGTQPQAANLKAWYPMDVDNATWNGNNWIIEDSSIPYNGTVNFKI